MANLKTVLLVLISTGVPVSLDLLVQVGFHQVTSNCSEIYGMFSKRDIFQKRRSDILSGVELSQQLTKVS